MITAPRMHIPLQEEPEWKVMRSIMMSNMAPQIAKKKMELLNQKGEKLKSHWENLAKYKGKVDIHGEAQCFCMELMFKLFFHIDVDMIGNPNHIFLENARLETTARKETFLSTLLYTYPSLSRFLKQSGNMTTANGYDYFVNICKELLNNRINQGLDEKDMISNFYRDLEKRKKTFGRFFSRDAIASLIVADLASACISFYDVGTLVARVLHCLAVNSEIQEKLRAQINENVDEEDGFLSYDIIRTMPYLDQCVNESLRMYPLNYRLVRTCNESIRYGNLHIKAGTIVKIPIYAVNQNPKYYPHPDIFDPDRFCPIKNKTRRSEIFVPFGGGPRDCPAAKLSLIIAKFYICRTLRSFKLSQIQETVDPLNCVSGLSGALSVSGEMLLGIQTV